MILHCITQNIVQILQVLLKCLIIYETIWAISGREASIIQCYDLYSHGAKKLKSL